MWIGQKVLRVNFQPTCRRPRGHYFREMRKPETDACTALHVYFGALLPPTIRSQYPSGT